MNRTSGDLRIDGGVGERPQGRLVRNHDGGDYHTRPCETSTPKPPARIPNTEVEGEGERLMRRRVPEGFERDILHQMLKLVRTLPDLAREESIQTQCLAEAPQFRPRELVWRERRQLRYNRRMNDEPLVVSEKMRRQIAGAVAEIDLAQMNIVRRFSPAERVRLAADMIDAVERVGAYRLRQRRPELSEEDALRIVRNGLLDHEQKRVKWFTAGSAS